MTAQFTICSDAGTATFFVMFGASLVVLGWAVHTILNRLELAAERGRVGIDALLMGDFSSENEDDEEGEEETEGDDEEDGEDEEETKETVSEKKNE